MRSPILNNTVLKIIIHNTAVSHAVNPDQWNQTNTYHEQMFNFKSCLGFYVGYTYEIAANGTVRQARSEGEETAAVLGQNRQSISICLDGNFDLEMPTLLQAQALQKLMAGIMIRWNLTAHKIFPHRGFCGTPPYKTCFGKLLPDNWGTMVAIATAPGELENLIKPPLGGITEPRLEAH